MDKESFQFLIKVLRPDLTYKDTKCHRAVTPKERLSTFLHFVATGKLKKMPAETAFALGKAKQ